MKLELSREAVNPWLDSRRGNGDDLASDIWGTHYAGLSARISNPLWDLVQGDGYSGAIDFILEGLRDEL